MTMFDLLIGEMTRGVKSTYSLEIFALITASHFVLIFSETVGTYFFYLFPLYYFFGAIVLFLILFIQCRKECKRTDAARKAH